MLKPLKDDVIGDIGNTLWVLMGTIGIVLLIACANVANLLLVRAEGRQQELAIRAALGAGWGRIAAGCCSKASAWGWRAARSGVGLAYGAQQLLVAIGAGRTAAAGRDHDRSLGAALRAGGIAGLRALLFGLIPVFKYAGPALGSALRQGGRSLSQSRERHRARSVLVVVQVALALVLLIGSGLMIRTFQAMRQGAARIHASGGGADVPHFDSARRRCAIPSR